MAHGVGDRKQRPPRRRLNELSKPLNDRIGGEQERIQQLDIQLTRDIVHRAEVGADSSELGQILARTDAGNHGDDDRAITPLFEVKVLRLDLLAALHHELNDRTGHTAQAKGGDNRDDERERFGNRESPEFEGTPLFFASRRVILRDGFLA